MHLSHGRLVSNLFLLFKCLVTVESICMYYVIVFSQCLSQMKYRLCFSILTSLLSFRCSSVTQTMSLSAWQPNGHVGAWGLGPGVWEILVKQDLQCVKDWCRELGLFVSYRHFGHFHAPNVMETV